MSQSGQKPKKNEKNIITHVIGLKMSTLLRILSVFRNFHSEERVQKVADSHTGFSGYMWSESDSVKKKLRIQK